MRTAMQEAMTEAMPDLQERAPLARQIVSVEQVAAMPTDELERQFAAHEAECVMMTGRLEADPGARWARGAKQALRVLHLHRGWITRELARRKKAASAAANKDAARTAAEARKAAQREMTERQQAADAARLERIRALNGVNAQHIATFKEVAREVLGAEMYAHLWELTRLRLEQPS